MTKRSPCSVLLGISHKVRGAIAFAAIFGLAPHLALAQHGGGGHAGGGHVGGSGSHSAPARSAPASAPARAPVTSSPYAVASGSPYVSSVRVFSGHNVWQDPKTAFPNSRNMALRFAKTPIGSSNQNPNSPFLGNRPLRRFPPFPPFFPGFWGGPFFGFGLGLGPGWGLGWDQCDPGWGWGYTSFCEPNNYTYGYYGPDAYLPPPPPPGEYEPEYPQPSEEGGYLYEAPPSEIPGSNEEQNHFEVVIYLRDGTVYLVSDYWLSGGELHYTLSDGNEYGIDMSQVDLQKTVDVNAKRGIHFTLRNSPDPDQPPPQPQRAPQAKTDQNAPAAPPTR